jgi:hypothetical protein
MNIGAILKDALQVFGFKDVASAPQQAKDRALNDINSTIQQLADAGEDFFTREELDVALLSETESYVLPKNIQTVLKPAKLDDGTILRELTSRGQLLQFGQLFMDELTNEPAGGRPVAYFVESMRDVSDTTGDNVAITVHVVPKPLLTSFAAGTSTLVLNVIKEPALFTAGQLTTGTALLEIPHKFIESVFLPLLRYNLSGSYLFQDKNKKPQIDADYERALRLFSKSDPRRDKPEESNAGALQAPSSNNQAPRRAA